MTDPLRPYSEIWLIDFEFSAPPGERPDLRCMVAREFRSGRLIRVWADELDTMGRPPFPIGADSLVVAYYASAELGCFLSLDWPMPARILDLFCEFRNCTNGLPIPCGNGLLGALAYYGLPSIDAADKEEMRELAVRSGPHSPAERVALLDYCQTDVDALARLLPRMLPQIDLPRALLRGRYMAAVAKMEWTGVPIDVPTLELLRENWETIQGELVERIDSDYQVYVPAGRQINSDSTLGAEILRTAEDRGIDPYRLADAVDMVWTDEKQAQLEQQQAISAARRSTGLNARRIASWEDSGRDHSTWPGLDTEARELAGQSPELGIGTGYDQDAGYDDTDYAGQLWGLLRYGADPVKPKHDPEILKTAADMVAAEGPQCRAARVSFSSRRFADWLVRTGTPWPRLPSGQLSLSDETFRQMARTHPAVAPLRELRHSLGEMRLFTNLAVGSDGRNRCLLSPFRSTTGRNQPSNSRFIFGPSAWLRGLIRPEPGQAVAYIDWAGQEHGIAAYISGDKRMIADYESGDPYLGFGKRAGLVPEDATKATHPEIRSQLKVALGLGAMYRAGPETVALSIDRPVPYAREMLQLHRQTYQAFWRWSTAAVDHAMLRGWLTTVFGWSIHVGPRANPRSLANFPMQANGAEMMRLACCLATERGIAVCCPVHDALLVEGPTDQMEDVVTVTQRVMAEASRIVLDGFTLRTDASVVAYPDRYSDPRGERMWSVVMALLGDGSAQHTHLGRHGTGTCVGTAPPCNLLSIS